MKLGYAYYDRNYIITLLILMCAFTSGALFYMLLYTLQPLHIWLHCSLDFKVTGSNHVIPDVLCTDMILTGGNDAGW